MGQPLGRTTKEVMAEWAHANLKPGQLYTKNQIVDWFLAFCSDFKRSTVATHVYSMSVNVPNRSLNYRNVKPGSGHDLFFKVDNKFRLWDPATDPAPVYVGDSQVSAETYDLAADDHAQDEPNESGGGDTFALEKDLQNYLVKNLSKLEGGLKLYVSDGVSGIEYNAGGRFIDILAVDAEGRFVVIELKVSRGYDRVIGQLQRYMAWVATHLADGGQVRGMIVASEITEDLVLATSLISDRVKLFEYSLSFRIAQKER